MKSSRKSLKKSRIFEKGADTRNIRKFSNSKYPHPAKETPGGEALDASENKEKRFCFMSNVDLLDILSNGNDPASINKFLK